MSRLLVALGALIVVVGCGSGTDPCALVPRGHAAGCPCVAVGSRLCPSNLVCDGRQWVLVPMVCMSDAGLLDASVEDASTDANADANDAWPTD
jgi:hypothetical protein